MAIFDTSDISRALLEKKWLALLAIGFLVLIFAACGGAGWLQLRDPFWRFLVAIVALLLCLFAVWGHVALRGDTDADLTKDYGFKITLPGDNANVGDEFTLEGTYEKKPPETIPIRAFIYSPYSGNYWPAGHKVQFFEEAKRWSVPVRPGGAKGDLKVAGIALLGQNAQLLCKHYDAVSKDIVDLRKKLGVHIGLPGIPEMSKDWKQLKTIRITRQ
jgi:hypothetical protein